MDTLQQKQLAFLNETVELYSKNPEKLRSLSDDGSLCLYASRGSSPGCPIGRHLPWSIANEYDKKMVGVAEIFDLLPSNLKELGLGFLRDVQHFHDNDIIWEKERFPNALTEAVDKIKKTYSLI